MFDSLQRIFGAALAQTDDPQTEARRLRLATCALLLEAAHADDEFTDAERGKISELVSRRFALGEDEVSRLLAAAEQARRESGDLYRFARELNTHFADERKLAIVEMLWEVVYSDGVLAAHEDALMHKLGTLLGIRHAQLMALKLQVKNRLA